MFSSIHRGFFFQCFDRIQRVYQSDFMTIYVEKAVEGFKQELMVIFSEDVKSPTIIVDGIPAQVDTLFGTNGREHIDEAALRMMGIPKELHEDFLKMSKEVLGSDGVPGIKEMFKGKIMPIVSYKFFINEGTVDVLTQSESVRFMFNKKMNDEQLDEEQMLRQDIEDIIDESVGTFGNYEVIFKVLHEVIENLPAEAKGRF